MKPKIRREEYIEFHKELCDKVVSVINSCNTSEQLNSAFKFVNLYFELIDRQQAALGNAYHAYFSGIAIGAEKIKHKQYEKLV